MTIRERSAADDDWLREVLRRDWGSSSMLVHGEELELLDFPALIAGERDGVAVFREGEPAELLLLSAFTKRGGIGTALVAALVDRLRARGVRSLRVTTTNDNLDALRFYQRRGFRLVALRPGAVNAARRRKPSIPPVGFNGIPLTDELDLELDLEAFEATEHRRDPSRLSRSR